MLEKVDLQKKLEKEEYRKRMDELAPRLGRLQRECQKWKIPVMIAFEGYGAAGKGNFAVTEQPPCGSFGKL